MEILKTVLQQMPNIHKPQLKFMLVLLPLLMCLNGRVNFRNLSRYSDYSEKTFSRWFRQPFDFVEFNRLSLLPLETPETQLIAATDCSFIPKSGKHTDGLGKFYNGAHKKAEKGLEISTLAIINVTENTAYNLSTRQTLDSSKDDETRVDVYLQHLTQDRHALPQQIKYLAADGYYAKIKYIDGVVGLDLHLISKLRHDANLRWLYQGEQKSRGCQGRRYDGKVKFNDLSRFTFVTEQDGLSVYTAIVNSVRFKRNLRIVYLVKQVGDKVQTALLFSTDLKLAAEEILRFYKARFQIEFLFRDAKQFLGLNDCQARCSQALHFHFNASMTALNLLKLEARLHRSDEAGESRRVISIASWKIRKANAHLLERFSTYLGLDFSCIKSRPDFEQFCNYGAIAA
jgi:hypothetical protein